MNDKINDLGDEMKDEGKKGVDHMSEKGSDLHDSLANKGNKEPSDTEEMEGL